MKTSNTWAVGISSLLASGVSVAQGGAMMDGGTGSHGMGWYGGGTWLLVIVCVAVVGGPIWAIQKRK